jgi:large subunit ribosomal protein L10e
MAKGIRPAKCYRWDSPAYTRVSNNPGDSFITGIPGSKLLHFELGNKTAEFDSTAQLVPETRIVIRHNSLESARIILTKVLEKRVGIANYFMKVNVYPHHVVRENVMATGAGADRVQDGMRRSFGKPMGRAARVRAGQPIFTVRFNSSDQRTRLIKLALLSAKKKLPGDYTLKLKEPPAKKKVGK